MDYLPYIRTNHTITSGLNCLTSNILIIFSLRTLFSADIGDHGDNKEFLISSNESKPYSMVIYKITI